MTMNFFQKNSEIFRYIFRKILMAVVVVCAFIFFPWIAPAFVFVCYLGYGLVVRPFLTRRMRRALEAADDDEPQE